MEIVVLPTTCEIDPLGLNGGKVNFSCAALQKMERNKKPKMG
ncbi:Hypothetical protein I595_1871 [Croceitalea dokdonensis DOKDO 023]|uniref:Uncharacterized protein n=1 Tax=Croceitalea dokdonensis DOKDO 023 TaxID=1300341 RepID=A0A0P7AW34_9FLAO|nr:Hypothetical protein I595_1871 [Croceitalea dokdonensis DOKDO 023]